MDKKTEEILLKDLWEKISKIDMNRNGDAVVCMPYNLAFHNFFLMQTIFLRQVGVHI